MHRTLALALIPAALVASLGCAKGSSSSQGVQPPPPPAISSIAPSTGPEVGGTTVSISGSGFVDGVTVEIGGAAATQVTVPSGELIVCDTPAGAPGAATVTVTNPDGQSGSLFAGYTFTGSGGGAAPPVLTGIAPGQGPAAGGQQVTLSGSALQSGATVLFGSLSATGVAVAADGASATCTTPAAPAGTVAVTLTNPDGQSATLSAAYTYTAALTVAGVLPAVGDVAGSTPVTVTGTGFATGASVWFGANAATNVVVATGTTLTASTPAGSVGTVDVSVANPGGTTVTLTGAFTYTSGGGVPTLTGVSPSTGPSPGCTVITLSGSGFAGGASVSVGGVAATNVTLLSTTQLTATTPPLPAGASGAQPVTVTNPGGGSATLTGAFTYTTFLLETVLAPAANADIAIDGKGILHAVWEFGPSPSEVIYARSTDGGCTWSAAANLSASANDHSRRPRVAASGNDVFVVWNETTTSLTSPEQVHFAYSAANGASWFAQPGASGPGAVFAWTGTWVPNPDVALGGGRLYVVYEKSGGSSSSGSGMAIGSGGQYVHLEMQHDVLGAYPLNPTIVQIENGNVAARAPSVACTQGVNGRVHVAWQQVNGLLPAAGSTAAWDILHSRSQNAGTSWSTPTNLTSSTTSCEAPTVVYLGNTIVSVWQEQLSTGGFTVGLARSTDGGASWGTALTLPASYPVMAGVHAAGDGFGGLTVVWSASSLTFDVHESRSTDGGATWSSPVAVAPGSGNQRQPRVVMLAGGAAMRVWIDDTASSSVPDVMGY